MSEPDDELDPARLQATKDAFASLGWRVEKSMMSTAAKKGTSWISSLFPPRPKSVSIRQDGMFLLAMEETAQAVCYVAQAGDGDSMIALQSEITSAVYETGEVLKGFFVSTKLPDDEALQMAKKMKFCVLTDEALGELIKTTDTLGKPKKRLLLLETTGVFSPAQG
jgi:hypothetical protein